MRLTLRTLLALRDEVLQPNDAAQLQSQINTSPLAKKLIERIDAGLEDSNVLSPAVDGRGLHRDPNTIAEYLENTLSEDKIPEIEKICFEQDSHLVEMAACHEILSRNKFDTSPPDDALRSRLIDLPSQRRRSQKNRKTRLPTAPSEKSNQSNQPNTSTESDNGQGLVPVKVVSAHSSIERRIDSGHSRLRPPHFEPDASKQSNDSDPTAPTMRDIASDSRVASQPETIRAPGIDLTDQSVSQQVPEYLRGRSTGNWKSAAVSGALIVMLLVVGWQSIGSFSNLKSLWNAESIASKNQGPERVTGGDLETGNSEVASGLIPDSNRRSTEPNIAGSILDESNANNATNNSLSDSEFRGGDPSNTEPNGFEPNGLMSVSGTTTATDLPQPSELKNDATIDLTPPPEAGIPVADSGEANQTSPPELVEPVGLWLPVDDAASRSIVVSMLPNSIQRVQPGGKIKSGQTILTAPYSKTQFQLGSGLNFETMRGARFTPLSSVGKNVASVGIEYGVFIATATADCLQLDVHHGQNICRFGFKTPNSSIAIRANQVVSRNEGTNLFVYDDILTIVPLSGEGTWQEISADGRNTGELNNLELATRIGWVQNQPIAIFELDSVPDWLKPPTPRRIDMRATTELFELVSQTATAEIRQVTAELVSYRRRETASLAGRLHIQMGSFEKIFGDDGLVARRGMRAYWDGIVQDLILFSSTNQPMREQCLSALQSAYGKPTAEKIGNLLRFIPQSQLEDGADRILVDSLSSDNLLVRVLANFQLQRITGRDMGFAADMSDDESIRNWRRLLNKRQIRYPTDPYPFDL